MSYYGLSDTGVVRENNEDYFCIKQISDNMLLAVVADGMGGHNGGEKASSFATNEIFKAVLTASKHFEKYSDRQIENFLKNTVIKTNKALYELALSDESLSGMGTTLVACIVFNEKYYVASIGDSRLYVHSDKLIQITKDHSYVAELLEMGAITIEEAKNHPGKNVITRAIGSEKSVEPDIYKGKLKENDLILICSDGLTNMVSDEIISKVITSATETEVITKKLLGLALENGGTDNVTVVCIRNDNEGGESL